MKILILLSLLIYSKSSLASVVPYKYDIEAGSNFIYYNSNYNAFSNEPSNGYYRTYGLEEIYIDTKIDNTNGLKFEASFRPDALIERQVDQENPTEYDTRAGVVYVSMSELKFLNTYELSFAPNDNFEAFIGVFYDFAKNEMAYEPILEFGLNTIFPQKYSAVGISWTYQSDFNQYANGKQLSKGGVRLSLMNSKDDRHETLASNNQTADTSNASLDDYLGVGINGFMPFNSELDLFANFGFVTSKNESLQATQSQLFFSLSALYRYQVLGVRSLVAYEFRFDKDSFSNTETNIPDLYQYSQSLTNVHTINKKIDLLWGIHQGASDNLNTAKDARVSYSGVQVDLSIRQKVRQNFFMNYWVDYEYRIQDNGNETLGGFTVDESDHKYLLRYAIQASYKFKS